MAKRRPRGAARLLPTARAPRACPSAAEASHDSTDPRVLLAASGSEASRGRLIAADLASNFDVQLTIVHVVAPVEPSPATQRA
jgi:hypothetical protein